VGKTARGRHDGGLCHCEGAHPRASSDANAVQPKQTHAPTDTFLNPASTHTTVRNLLHTLMHTVVSLGRCMVVPGAVL